MDSKAMFSSTEGVWVTDGAWGTRLQAMGLKAGACPDAWNLENASAVREVVRSYVEVGSQLVLTNTFGANRFILDRHGLADRVVEINEAGAAISKSEAGGSALVCGTIGPSGKMIMMGEVSTDELRQAFAEQARALAAGGADALVVESMCDLEEVLIVCAAAREATMLPLICSLTYDSGSDKTRTMMGVSPEQAAEALEAAGVDVIGANCGVGVHEVIPVCKKLRTATARPLWMKPNLGLPRNVEGKTVYAQSLDEFLAGVVELARAGANFIGGCCGTTPEHIRGVRKVLEEEGILAS